MWITKDLEPALYMVSTPIGAARDITLRALDVLASTDVIAAEDTRVTRKLLDIHGVSLNGRRLVSYHEHSGENDRQKLVDHLKAGQSVAYASDAGTPLVADPGFQLVKAALEAEQKVVPVPGASAVLASLTLSGLPTDRFFFAGFLPNSDGARRKALEDLKRVAATLVFFENPRRVKRLLMNCADILGEERRAAVARELTKKFEECRRGTLADLIELYDESDPRGECVVLVEKGASAVLEADQITEMLNKTLADHSLKEAVSLVVEASGLPRRVVYQAALELRDTK